MNFYKIDCGNDTKYLKNFICQLKPISRGTKSLTIYAEQVLQIDNFWEVNYEILHKSSRNDFQNVMLNTTIEFCSSISNLPPFYKLLVSLVEKSAINLIHECPYPPVKQIGIKNFIVNSNMLAFVTFLGIKNGHFLVTGTARDEKGDLYAKIKLYFVLEKERIKKITKKN